MRPKERRSIPFSKRGRACFEQVTQKRLVNMISRFFAVKTIKIYAENSNKTQMFRKHSRCIILS